MTGVLAALVVVIGVLAGADFLLTFAVIRRLAAIERKSGTAADAIGISPPPGYRVRDFRLPLLSGGDFSRADLADSRVTVVFVTPTCKPCRDAITDLKARQGALHMPLYVLIARSTHDHAADHIIEDLPAEAIVGEVSIGDSVTQAFAVDGFPTVLMIEDGVVRANGLKVSSLPEPAWR